MVVPWPEVNHDERQTHYGYGEEDLPGAKVKEFENSAERDKRNEIDKCLSDHEGVKVGAEDFEKDKRVVMVGRRRG